jgi:hypothetical protein
LRGDESPAEADAPPGTVRELRRTQP